MVSKMKPSEVYILHFDEPYWGKARHYVGYTTKKAEERISLHRNGKGSLLVNYAHNKRNIPFRIGLIERYVSKELARNRELKLKREKHLSRHCEICRGGSDGSHSK